MFESLCTRNGWAIKWVAQPGRQLTTEISSDVIECTLFVPKTLTVSKAVLELSSLVLYIQLVSSKHNYEQKKQLYVYNYHSMHGEIE